MFCICTCISRIDLCFASSVSCRHLCVFAFCAESFRCLTCCYAARTQIYALTSFRAARRVYKDRNNRNIPNSIVLIYLPPCFLSQRWIDDIGWVLCRNTFGNQQNWPKIADGVCTTLSQGSARFVLEERSRISNLRRGGKVLVMKRRIFFKRGRC